MTYDLMVVYVDHEGRSDRIAFSDPELAPRYLQSYPRAWLGDIFFDHVRGVVIPNPAAWRHAR
jgi:hypothetical protein